LKEIAMAPHLSMTATAVLALLANPALAEDIRQHVAIGGSQIATPAAQDAFATRPAIVVGVAHPLMEQWIITQTAPPERCEASLSKLVFKTAEPIVNLVQGSGEGAGQWLASKANAAAQFAENANQWVTTNTEVVVLAVQDTGQWIASRSAEFAVMARDAGQWITVNTNSAVYGTSEWISSSSSAAANSLVATASAIVGEWIIVEGWSERVVKEIEHRLRAKDAGEFSALLKESGFVLTNINIGVGLIPDLDIEFTHERTLSPEELSAFKAKVQKYVEKTDSIVGFAEGLILKKILKAGEYSGAAHISDIRIDLFPLPDLMVSFDPLRFKDEQNKMIADAYDFSQSGAKDLKSMHERLLKIEAYLPRFQANN
jgi:hypothetical protein